MTFTADEPSSLERNPNVIRKQAEVQFVPCGIKFPDEFLVSGKNLKIIVEGRIGGLPRGNNSVDPR